MNTLSPVRKVSEIEKTIDRLKNTQSYLKNSAVKQIRMRIGDFTPLAVCDSIFSTAEFKKEYLRRINYRIIDLEIELSAIKNKIYENV